MDSSLPLFRTLGISVPIVQAPIGNACNPDLAAAISNAGGVGALALTGMPAEVAASLVGAVRRRTSGAFLANFILAFEPASLGPALEAGVPVITFSWGMPRREAPMVRSHGAKFGIQISTRGGAKQALDIGADFLICQGVEAGGHVQATQSLWSVLPEVCEEAAGVPVVAAGGLATGSDIARAMKAGAAAVMMGTRFVATKESAGHSIWKQMLVDADDAALTLCFDLGWPYAAHRVLRNKTLEQWEEFGCPPTGNRPGEGDVVAVTAEGEGISRYSAALPLEGMTGSVDELCLYSGTGCVGIDDVPAAGDLVARLWNECRGILAERP